MEYYQTEVYFPGEGRKDWASAKALVKSGDKIGIIPSDKLTEEEAKHNQQELQKKHRKFDFRVARFDYSLGND